MLGWFPDARRIIVMFERFYALFGSYAFWMMLGYMYVCFPANFVATATNRPRKDLTNRPQFGSTYKSDVRAARCGKLPQ